MSISSYENIPCVRPSISSLGDVQVNNPTNGQSLIYNSTSGNFENVNSGVSSNGSTTLSSLVNGIPNPPFAGYKCVKYSNLAQYSVQVLWRNATPGTVSSFILTLPFNASYVYGNKYSINSEVVGIGTFSAVNGNSDSSGSLSFVIVETVNNSNNQCLVTFVPTTAAGNVILIINQNL